MTDQVLKIDKELSPAEANLHMLAHILASRNISANVEVQSEQLEFLKEIEMKTASDIEKIEEARKLLALVESEEYFIAVRNTFAEHYAKMDSRYIDKYLEEIEYESAIAAVGLTLVPALYKVRDDFVYGTVSKPTLQ